MKQNKVNGWCWWSAWKFTVCFVRPWSWCANNNEYKWSEMWMKWKLAIELWKMHSSPLSGANCNTQIIKDIVSVVYRNIFACTSSICYLWRQLIFSRFSFFCSVDIGCNGLYVLVFSLSRSYTNLWYILILLSGTRKKDPERQ